MISFDSFLSSKAANFLFCVNAMPFGGFILGLRIYPYKVYDINDQIFTLRLFDEKVSIYLESGAQHAPSIPPMLS